MQIAFLLYEGFTALDLIGPHEVIGRWPNVQIHLVAEKKAPVRSDLGLAISPSDTFETVHSPEVLVVPGGDGTLSEMRNEALLKWIRQVATKAAWMASVCTGAGIYAAADLLEGRRATTHWAFREPLKAMGVEVVSERVVFDQPFVSGAGVSAGIDMALALTNHVHGERLAKALQLGIEYDPQPIFDSGAVEKASAGTRLQAMRMLLGNRPTVALHTVAHVARHRIRRLPVTLRG